MVCRCGSCGVSRERLIAAVDPKLGRAEALRRAALDYMNDASNPRNAYPAFWAPFEVVGERGAK